MSVEVVPATPDRWADVRLIMAGHSEPGDDRGCWCQAPRGRVTGAGSDPSARPRALLDQLAEDPPAGLLAYVGGEVAGWIGFAPRPLLPRLERSRTIPKLDDIPVWSVLCFRIPVGHRRRGVATALLGGLIAYARERGAPGLEAYPIDSGGKRLDAGFSFVGLVSMFDKAGFEVAAETSAHSAGRERVLMRRMFTESRGE
ncbi:MAG TPA: GNAT family N-acetyltransferase [Patescibacteria group bacterium]|nr:GNAT family N-acetyltransferase [Patescibacteria group bacterium]